MTGGAASDAPLLIETPSGTVAVRVRRSPRARRLRLAVSGAAREAVLTVPRRVTRASAEAFARDHRAWLGERLAALPRGAPFVAGGEIMLRGTVYAIAAGAGRAVMLDETGDGPLVLVPGPPARLHARLLAFCRRAARADLEAAVAHHAGRLGVVPASLSLRDPKSRWGSCSGRGRLSFSWRLVLAPPPVLGYVAAHEVAHLREMNHGAGFWRLVAETCPDYQASRVWLRRNGAELHRYGADG